MVMKLKVKRKQFSGRGLHQMMNGENGGFPGAVHQRSAQ